MTAPRRFAFVLEQTLGHVAHSHNLERALAEAPWIRPTVVKLPYLGPEGRPGRVWGVSNWSVRASVMARRSLRRRLGEGPLDAVFVHTQVAALFAVGVMRSVPTVISLDATPKNFDEVGEAYGHGRAPGAAERVKLGLNRRALHSAAALVTWSRQAMESLVADYEVAADRVHVIPPGVDVTRFSPGSRSAGRGEASSTAVRVLFVGGDFKRKGGRELLEALAGLGTGVEVDLVTGGPVERLPAGLVCRVHPGLQPGDAALADLYGRADLFALPSRGDCLPQVLAEAAAAGLPIVATRVGAIPEVVKDGLNGMLVRSRSQAELRSALRMLIENPRLRRSMGEESRALALREHDAGLNNRRIFDLMNQLAVARSQAEPAPEAA
jgi:glycosyltransferase involved in cell wall biosynthesis